MSRKDTKYKTAVIFRTNRDAAELAELLTKKGIPFWMKEKLKSPYRSQTALDLRAYLSFVFAGQRRSDFFRIMNRPKRYISRSAVDTERVDLDRLKAFYRDKPYMKEILRKLEMDLARLKLALLDAENIRVRLFKIIQKAFPHAGPQSVYIP